MRQSSCGLSGALRGMGQGNQKPLWTSLPRLDVPTLILAGSDDAKYTGLAVRMVEILPDSTLKIVRGAGHDLPAEKPLPVAAHLRDFWKRNAAK